MLQFKKKKKKILKLLEIAWREDNNKIWCSCTSVPPFFYDSGAEFHAE